MRSSVAVGCGFNAETLKFPKAFNGKALLAQNACLRGDFN